MPAEWGQAKIEILALRDEILGKIEQGVLVRTIYEELSASGRITMSRRSFYDRVKQLRSGRTTPKTQVPAKAPGQSSATPTHTVSPSNTQAASFLPTLKAKEQAALDRLWGGEDPEDDASDETEASQ
ncbi:hypothetical protein [Thalassospira sp. MCCC 1A02491]|uniref:hypothetical protein n=1 Tax=Thalassospira sp. MCCC 1A02491 TaxID=1769751 RepID=UPI0007AD7131|nr:hypothetical protein [Thalassospira sp. MCCC 1A02491]KZB63112.1 hypothetical protein AUQ42_15380 [Thalassospira sp. MCCC 1A02491]